MRAILVVPALLCYTTLAFAQAGSTGGSIGKQGKSVSGGTEAPPPVVTQPAPRRPAPTAIPAAKSNVFINPTLDGKRVDRCLSFGQGCNEPAATHWCRSKGFERAVEWESARARPTILQKDRSVCDFLICDGFTRVVCE
jgi:hypothetical protein